MKTFVEQPTMTSWLLITSSFILTFLSIRLGCIDLTFLGAVFYTLIQTYRLLVGSKRESSGQVVRVLGILLAGLVTCFCLATAIGVNCINPDFTKLGSLTVIYVFIGVLFPITYHLFITCMLGIQSYAQRGTLLIVWSLIATFYFRMVAKNHSINADCTDVSVIPKLIILIPVILVLYGIYLIQFNSPHRESFDSEEST